MNANFNDDSLLFANSREIYRKEGISLVVVDGHIIAGSMGVVARCANDAAACHLLEQAEYTRDQETRQIIYNP